MPSDQTILIVEHSPAEREKLSHMFEQMDFACTACSSGLEALALLKQRSSEFSLVVLNIALPDIDGISMLGHCKGHYPHLPVILTAKNASVHDITEAIKAKADVYIPLPPEPSRLEEAVHKLLPGHMPQKRSGSGNPSA